MCLFRPLLLDRYIFLTLYTLYTPYTPYNHKMAGQLNRLFGGEQVGEKVKKFNFAEVGRLSDYE